MRVVVASGKGGTGKTTVAINLASMAVRLGRSAVYADCDVEEPNGHLFLKPSWTGQAPVSKPIPRWDPERCDGCGQCARFCQFNALLRVRSRMLFYPELCHACGGCRRVCPRGAIAETESVIGEVAWGRAGALDVYQGCLQVGQAQSPPVIRAVKAALPAAELVLLDAPPGTACPVVETVRQADFLLLVTEPTPFGLYDLGLALAMARSLGVACGVVINRAWPNRSEARHYCDQVRVPVLAEIPENLALARASSAGHLAIDAVLEFQGLFAGMIYTLLCRS